MGANYATKKALRESVGEEFRYIETSVFGNEFHGDGEYTVVGPDPYKARNWYATVTVRDGRIVKVR